MDKTIKILVIIVLAMTAVILGWFIFSIVVGPYLAMQSARQSIDATKVGNAIQIQSVARAVNGQVTVYVQNVGDSTVQLANVFVNGELNSGATSTPAFGANLDTGATAVITLSGDYSTAAQLTIKVAAEDGTFIEYTKTFT